MAKRDSKVQENMSKHVDVLARVSARMRAESSRNRNMKQGHGLKLDEPADAFNAAALLSLSASGPRAESPLKVKHDRVAVSASAIIGDPRHFLSREEGSVRELFSSGRLLSRANSSRRRNRIIVAPPSLTRSAKLLRQASSSSRFFHRKFRRRNIARQPRRNRTRRERKSADSVNDRVGKPSEKAESIALSSEQRPSVYGLPWRD